MRFLLGIFIIGLLFNSGYGKPVIDEEEAQADTPLTQGNPVITTRPQEFVAETAAEINLPCMVEHNEGDDSILWMHNNITVFIDAHGVGPFTSFAVNDNHTLTIKSFTDDLSGNYSCAIPLKNLYITHVVKRKDKVGIEAITAKKYVENLSELSIMCRVKGFPTPVISWTRKSSENAVEYNLGSKTSNYVIPSATFSDTGIYTCTANNGETSDSKSVTVTVINGIAPESSKVFAGQSEGSSKLCCVFDKNRKITWLKEGKDVQMSDRIGIESEKHKNCLVIKKAKEEDLGKYTCQTEKNAMENSEIELAGAPAKPIAKVISATNDESKTPYVTWSIISLFPISEYKVYARNAGETEWKELEHKKLSDEDKKDEITYTFSNLSNGRHSVKLEVINKYGANDSVENGAVVVDRYEPNVIMSAKINSGNGGESQYRISSLCVIFVILMRLWSC